MALSVQIPSNPAKLTALLLICSILPTTTNAEVFGSPSGRTANFSTQPPLSVEASLSNGDFDSVDYQQMGLRVNYKYAPKITMFGDIGKSKLSSQSETSFGFGAFYSLSQPVLGKDSAIKVSFHQAKFDGTYRSGGLRQQCTTDYSTITGLPTGFQNCTAVPAGSSSTSGETVRNLSFEFLVSGAMPANSVLGSAASWYANTGVQVFRASDNDTILGFGAGIVVPVSKSEVYGGFEFAEDPYIGVGFRYFVE